MALFGKPKNALTAKNSGFRYEIITAPDFGGIKLMVKEPPLKDWFLYIETAKKLSENTEKTEEQKATELVKAEAMLFVKCVRDVKGGEIFATSDIDEIVEVYGNNHSRLLNVALELFNLKSDPIKQAEKK